MALTPAEQQELAQLEAQIAQAPSQGGLTPEEQMELAQLEKQYAQPQQAPSPSESNIWEKVKRYGGAGLDYGVRGLDYVGGLSRTTAAEGLDMLSPNDVVRDGDWGRALRGQAPPSADYLERLGVTPGQTMSDMLPRMYSETGGGLPLQKGGWADPSSRAGAGLIMDVASDPLTYASAGIAPAAKYLGKGAQVLKGATSVAGNLTSKVGNSMYKSGLKNIDKFAADFGKVGAQAPSEVLAKYNISGTNKTIQKKANEQMSNLKSQYDSIVDEATKTIEATQATNGGAPVFNMKEATATAQERINAVLNAEKKDPILFEQAQEAQRVLDKYTSLDYAPAREQVINTTKVSPLLDQYGQKIVSTSQELKKIPGSRAVTPTEAKGFKESLYKTIPNSAWDNLSKSDFGKQFTKDLAVGMKDQTEKAVQMTTGRGAELNQVGQDLGTLLTSRKAIRNEAKKGTTKDLLTSVDGLAAAYSPQMFLMKKGADLSKTTGFRTTVGKKIKDAGRSGWVDPLVRQTLIRNNREDEQPAPPSAWQSVRGY
jgi:DNA-binding ferritin-like protein